VLKGNYSRAAGWNRAAAGPLSCCLADFCLEFKFVEF